VRLEALRSSERRVVRILGMVGLTLDETLFFKNMLENCFSIVLFSLITNSN